MRLADLDYATVRGLRGTVCDAVSVDHGDVVVRLDAFCYAFDRLQAVECTDPDTGMRYVLDPDSIILDA